MRYWVIALVCCLLLSACGGPAYTAQQQTVDRIQVTFEHPTAARVLDTYDMFITLKDASGATIDDATVFLDLTMPVMPMGQNQPLAEAEGKGRYKVSATYTMEGDWIVLIHIKTGGKEYQARFDQMVDPPQ